MRNVFYTIAPIAGLMRLSCALISFCLFSVASPCFAYRDDDPRRCIEELQQAIDNADEQRFASLMDMDGIIREFFSELEVMADDPEKSKLLPPLVSLIVSQGALRLEFTRSILVDEMKDFVLYGVGSGAFAGRKSATYESSSMLAPLFALASLGRKEVIHIAPPQRLDEQQSLVAFTVFDHDNGSNYYIEGLVTRESDRFRLMHITNIASLITQVCLEAQAQEQQS